MTVLSMGPVHLRTSPGWQFFHRYDVSTDEFQLFMRLTDHSGDRWAVNPLTFTKIPSGSPIPQSMAAPTEYANPDINSFLQAAMDVAWELGMRPSGYEEPMNELKAVRYHLEDMRKLAKVK